MLQEGVCYNWLKALLELVITQHRAEYYCIFQDDVIARRGLRKYLERWFPEDGYLNLYTGHDYESAPHRPPTGWWKTPQKGRGALGLIFDRVTALTLVSDREFIISCMGRHSNRQCGKKGVDGEVVLALNRLGRYEYCHSSSLLQHIGVESVAGNTNNRRTNLFPGEEVDPSQEV